MDGLLAALLASGALAGSAAATNETSREFPCQVQYELGDAEFAPGDSINIQELRGTSGTIVTGQTYCVQGTYTLSSREEADLALFATTLNTNPTPKDPKQIVRIKKGTGAFRLTKTMTDDGYLHVTFYPVSSGRGFGGVYFGQGKWVLRNKNFSYLNNSSRPPGQVDSGGSTLVSRSGANQALFDYLGNPVEPPPNLDPAYTRVGLVKAMQLAASKAGVTLKRLEIDDSEFPFLVGFICEEGGFLRRIPIRVRLARTLAPPSAWFAWSAGVLYRRFLA